MSFCGKTLLLVLVLSGFTMLGNHASAQAGSQCGVQTITIPAPAGSSATPSDLNDNGAIVGTLFSGTGLNVHTSGFLYSGGVFTHFSFPGAKNTSVHDMNKQGVIVGSFDAPDGNGQRAFMVHNGTFTQVQIPGFPNAPAIAQTINDQGDIAGSFNGNGTNFGFLLHQGQLTTLSFPGAQVGTFPNSINNAGVIVGIYRTAETDPDHGFMWQNGVFNNFTFPGSVSTTPIKINEAGKVVGTYIDSNQVQHGFAFVNNQFINIDPLGSASNGIVAFNSFDNLLSIATTASGHEIHKDFCGTVF